MFFFSSYQRPRLPERGNPTPCTCGSFCSWIALGSDQPTSTYPEALVSYWTSVISQEKYVLPQLGRTSKLWHCLAHCAFCVRLCGLPPLLSSLSSTSFTPPRLCPLSRFLCLFSLLLRCSALWHCGIHAESGHQQRQREETGRHTYQTAPVKPLPPPPTTALAAANGFPLKGPLLYTISPISIRQPFYHVPPSLFLLPTPSSGRYIPP